MLGYELRETSVEPQKARVSGPASKLRALEYVATEPIDVSGKEADLNLDVEVRGPPAPLPGEAAFRLPMPLIP